jgi:serine/threonine protein kinase
MRFKLVCELGRGSSGIVYKAIDRVTHDTVAVKQLLPTAVLPPQREVLLARKITHVNVCRVHDLYREEGTTFISMEFVDGECLKGPLPEPAAIPIAMQICDGLEAAHRQGIVHGDLKPANILLTRGGVPKLTDFGLAQYIDSDATTWGAIAGTRDYMAPELYQGKKPDVLSDIYALGMVLKDLGLDGPVAAKCLAQEPDERFASAAEVREALEHPAGVVKPVSKNIHRVLVASLAVVVAAGVFLAWSGSNSLPRTHSAAAPVPAKPAVAVLFGEDAFTPALIRSGKFRIVERAELDRVLAELKLNSNEAFDPATAQRVGKLVGAEYLLLGGTQAAGTGVRLNARLVRTETGEVVAAETASGREGNLTELANTITERLVNHDRSVAPPSDDSSRGGP